ncbi:MAG: hypothetical protein LBL82_08735 [Oscillospiraceae bacterium]|nr:hypothetical protein [Oscillospiraceae bacterium]
MTLKITHDRITTHTTTDSRITPRTITDSRIRQQNQTEAAFAIYVNRKLT